MYVWNHDGVKIFSTMGVEAKDNTVVVKGTGVQETSLPSTIPFAFTAISTHQGWYVEIETGSGRRGSMQGGTYNLPLEVAASARRIL